MQRLRGSSLCVTVKALSHCLHVTMSQCCVCHALREAGRLPLSRSARACMQVFKPERAPAQKWWTQGRKSRRVEAAAAAAETSAVMRSQRQRIQRALGAAVDADPAAERGAASAGPQAAAAGPGPAGPSGGPAAAAAAAGEAFSPFANLPTPEEYWADAGEDEVLSPAALDADAQREWRAFLKEAKGDTARPAAGPARCCCGGKWSRMLSRFEVAGWPAALCAARGCRAKRPTCQGVPRATRRPLRCTEWLQALAGARRSRAPTKSGYAFYWWRAVACCGLLSCSQGLRSSALTALRRAAVAGQVVEHRRRGPRAAAGGAQDARRVGRLSARQRRRRMLCERRSSMRRNVVVQEQQTLHGTLLHACLALWLILARALACSS